MKPFIQKLLTLERQASSEKGEFILFALFLRADSPEYWDLLVCAPWIDRDPGEALRYLARALNEAASPEEVIKLSAIVIIEQSNPGLSALQDAISIEHGNIEVHNASFFGLDIKRAHIITSRREAVAIK